MVPEFVDAKMLGTRGWGEGKLKVQRLSPEKKSKTTESPGKVRISGGGKSKVGNLEAKIGFCG